LFGACLLIDIAAGFVFMLGMDIHIGRLGSISPSSHFWIPFVVLQALLLARLLARRSRPS